jgi:hypothetical protein
MLFSKEDLQGFYNWGTDPEKMSFDGNASRRLFDRWNGDQVLFIINILLNNSTNTSVSDGQKIEKLILDRLPTGAKSELTVYNWLQLEITKQ